MPIMTEVRARAQNTAPALLALLPVVLGLRAALARHGSVTISTADDLGDLMGLTTFDGQLVELAADLNPDEWRTTLVHELLHVLRGPCGRENVDAEELHIERLVDDVEQLLTAAAPRRLRSVGAR